jgi:hypothetical protein
MVSSIMNGDQLKTIAKKSFTLRRLGRWYISKTRYFDWGSILNQDASLWDEALRGSKENGKVLIATSVGSQIANTHLESLLGVALVLRNVQVEFLLCDSLLPACMACEIAFFKKLDQGNSKHLSKILCNTCFPPAFRAYQSLGIPIHTYRQLISEEDIEIANNISAKIPFGDIPDFMNDGLSVGEHALAGTLRFFARGDLNEAPFAESILRQYLTASLLTKSALIKLLTKTHFDCAVFSHGIYVPHGLVGEVCRKYGVRVVNWNPAYRKRCFIFSHDDTYHHTMLSEPVEKWTDIEWNGHLESELFTYLKSRWSGDRDWIWFHEKPIFEIGIDSSKPCIGMLTSVAWDAALHYPSNAFKNMFDWIVRTVEYFAKRQDLQLIIRVHPAEIQAGLPSRQRVADELKKIYPEMPNNVLLIPPESNISTYALMQECDTAIIYNTKTGIELTAMGIPVIVAGEAWIRNKGFAIDVSNAQQYFRVLDQLPSGERMSNEDTLKAKKYAYHFFFRRMIPLDFTEPTSGSPLYKMNIADLKNLLPGRSKGLDTICNGIINGTDFINS